MLWHMDDCVVIGPRGHARRILGDMSKSLLVTGVEIIGEDADQIQILGRILRKGGNWLYDQLFTETCARSAS